MGIPKGCPVYDGPKKCYLDEGESAKEEVVLPTIAEVPLPNLREPVLIPCDANLGDLGVI